jgi:hypothetical protein
MSDKLLKSAEKALLLVALLGIQGVVLAGRIEYSVDSSERVKASDNCSSVNVVEQSHGFVVHDSMVSDSIPGTASDAQLADYLELHGRVVEGSIRSTMMPWSALQHVAD